MEYFCDLFFFNFSLSAIVSVVYVRPKMIFLPVWGREADREDTPAAEGELLGCGPQWGPEVGGFAEREVEAARNYSIGKSGLPPGPELMHAQAPQGSLSPAWVAASLSSPSDVTAWGPWRVTSCLVTLGDKRLLVLHSVYKSTSSLRLFLYLQG